MKLKKTMTLKMTMMLMMMKMMGLKKMIKWKRNQKIFSVKLIASWNQRVFIRRVMHPANGNRDTSVIFFKFYLLVNSTRFHLSLQKSFFEVNQVVLLSC